VTTVNLYDKIKKKREGHSERHSEEGSSLQDRIRSMASEGNTVSNADKIMSVLFILSIAALYSVSPLLDEYHFKDKMQEVFDQEQALDQELAALTTKLASYNTIKAEIESFEKKVADLKAKIAMVENVQKGRNSLVRMVDKVIEQMPESVWLTKISITRNEPRTGAQGEPVQVTPGSLGRIEVSGFARSMQLVSRYMENLQGTVFFPNWQLVETSDSVGTEAGAQGARATSGPPAESKKFDIHAEVMNQ
jgi:Tfp pilus assembly protein PilN